MSSEIKAIVVDDELTALSTFLAHVVDKYNCSFRPFSSKPLEAIEYVKTNKVDVAFLDINMDVIDGVSLAVELIKADKDIRIIFITGYASDEVAIKEKLKDNLLGFCYKPYDMNVFERFIMQVKEIRDKKRNIFIKTFGPFDVFIENIPMMFSSSKSKELLAYLVDNNGSIILMNSCICALWPDKDIDRSKILYRDAVWRLRKTLEEYNLASLVDFKKGQLCFNKRNIECDYFAFLSGDHKLYNGIYMENYEWSLDRQGQLDDMI